MRRKTYTKSRNRSIGNTRVVASQGAGLCRKRLGAGIASKMRWWRRLRLYHRPRHKKERVNFGNKKAETVQPIAADPWHVESSEADVHLVKSPPMEASQ